MAKDASHSLLGPQLRRAETVTKQDSTLPGEGRASLDSEADQGASEISQPHPAWGSSRLSRFEDPMWRGNMATTIIPQEHTAERDLR